MMFPKPATWRSEKYKKWIKKQSCVLCYSSADDPHHLIGVGNLSGMGMTAPDWTMIPVCRQCHDKIHEDAALWESQWEMIARTLGRAISEGYFKG